jgi:hypothetical protein
MRANGTLPLLIFSFEAIRCKPLTATPQAIDLLDS